MKNKNVKKKILYPFSTAIIATGLLLTNTAAPSPYINIGYAEELNGSIDPFTEKDIALLSQMESQGISYLNNVRASLGLPAISINPTLTKAAQSHSNYLVKYHEVSHLQTKTGDSAFYTGPYAEERSAYFGYPSVDSVGEGISFQNRTAVNGLEKLIAAPYHRETLLDPNFTEGGIGFNDTSDDFNPTVINLSNSQNNFTKAGPVMYPANNQSNVKTEWYANESPNPLRFWGLDNVYVGYPISISVYGKDSGKLIANEVSLIDENGQDIPVYVVDGNKDGTLSSIFVIPKEPLAQGTTYTVSVDANSVSKYNQVTSVNKKWSFKTIGGYELRNVDILQANASTKVLKVSLNNGDVSGMKWELRDQNNALYQTYNERGSNGYLGYKSIVDGTYQLKITFANSDQVIMKNIVVAGDSASISDGAVNVPSQDPEQPPVEGTPVEEEQSEPTEPPAEETPAETQPNEPEQTPQEEEPEQDSAEEEPQVEEETPQSEETPKVEEEQQPEEEAKEEEPKEEQPEEEQPEEVSEPASDDEQNPSSTPLEDYQLVRSYDITDEAKGIRIPFSVAIDDSTITNESVFLLDEEGNRKSITSKMVDDKHLEIRFNDLELENGQKYELYMDKTIKGKRGNELPQASKFILNVKGDPNNNPFDDDDTVTGTPLNEYESVGEREIEESQQSTSFDFPFDIKTSSITPQTIFMMDENGEKQPINVIVNRNKVEIAFDDMKLEAGQKYKLYFDWYHLEGEDNQQLEKPQLYELSIIPDKEEPTEDQNSSNEETEQPSNPSEDEETNTNEPNPPSSNTEDEEDEEDDPSLLARYELVKEYNIKTTSKGFRIPFSVKIDKETITNESVFFLDSSAGGVNATIALTPDGKALEVKFEPDLELREGQQFTLYINDTIKGVKGNALSKPSKFVINVVKEKVGPSDLPKDVDKYQLRDMITNVRPNQTFSVTFTGKLDKNTVNSDTVFVLDENNQKVEMDIKLTSNNTKLMVKPTNNYQSGVYTLYIDDAVKASNGKNLKQAIKVPFSVR